MTGLGYSDFPDVDVPPPYDDDPVFRRIKLTSADTIKIRPVHWLWTDRIALGTLALLGGREGIGKSTVAYQLAGDITRGRLAGRFHGTPRAVIVAATEDSWKHTIVPCLIGADADLTRVYRVDVETVTGAEVGLSLPRDLGSLADAVREVDAALILLDPLMSRLDAKLDTHKDAEVRQALEPLVRIADQTNAAILGLIHLNKSLSTDPLTMLMGSRAFAAVARAVLFAMVDPEDETKRILGQPKNNLGRTDLPTLAFQIVSAHVADTDEGPVWTGRVDWQGESTRLLGEVLEAASDGPDARTATQEAGEWLGDWLVSVGGVDDSASIKRKGQKAGHSQDSLKRARRRIGALIHSEGFPRRTFWSLPDSQPVGAPSGETAPTAPTTPTAPTGAQWEQLAQSVQSAEAPGRCSE
ncbi:AAA domain-containing protein [Nocardioides scoriae]|uniref:AAA domain-containing protein n=1 Tax=Nocardioides scoriae TaxID=642780 RepID=A0A1H1QCG6_9ACTN|nr:AAA family ATPase [Nocardioides scoriae]SDS21231.1 AAA domain-containing protein [Nocardioides scoriae]